MRQYASFDLMACFMKFLTIEDVCEMLSISRRTLERMRVGRSATISDLVNSRGAGSPSALFDRTNRNISGERLPFPEPDIYLGKSPRWDRDKLLKWLEENGDRL